MKKIILPAIFFLLLLFPEGIFAQYDNSCSKRWISEGFVCGEAYSKCYEQCGAAPGIAPDSCYKSCDNTSKACNIEADANFETCKSTSKNKTPAPSAVKELQPTAVPTTTQKEDQLPQPDQTDQAKTKPVKQNETDEDGSSFSLFGFNPMATWRNIWELISGSSSLMDIDSMGKFFYGDPIIVDLLNNPPGSFDSKGNSWNFLPGFFPSGDGKIKVENGKKNAIGEENRDAMFKYSDLPKRTPELTEEIIKQYQEEREKMMGSGQKEASPYSVDILRGQAQIKYPNENQWRDVKVGEKIPQGSTIVTGMDSTTILTIEGVGVVEIAPFTEIKIDQSGIEQATLNKELFNDIELNEGEIEVNIESGVFTAPILDVHTPNATTSVRGTHFWVLYKDNQTAVGVYKGKVALKTTDGKVKEITPNGDQPGVMVVSQKLSPVKLGVTGLVLVAIIGGVTIFLKRKFAIKGYSKKKR